MYLKARVLLVMIANSFLALLMTLLSSYFYVVTPRTVDAGFTRRGWPLWWVEHWWSSWSIPPSYGTIFNSISLVLDFFFWLTIFLVPQIFYYAGKKHIRRSA